MCVARWARALWIPSTDRVENLILELYASEAPLENLSSGVTALLASVHPL